MYDEFVKELREAENYAKEVGTNPYRFVPYYGKAANIIETLIEVIQNHNFLESLTKPRWIPVTEPPKEDGWYQVYAPEYSGGSSSGLKNINGNMYSAFKHGKWSIETGYHKRPGCVKAWMPLPEPPERLKEEE